MAQRAKRGGGEGTRAREARRGRGGSLEGKIEVGSPQRMRAHARAPSEHRVRGSAALDVHDGRSRILDPDWGKRAGEVARLEPQRAAQDVHTTSRTPSTVDVIFIYGSRFLPNDEPVHGGAIGRADDHIPGRDSQRGEAAPKHKHLLVGRQHQRPLVRAGQQQHAAASRAVVHRRLDAHAEGDRHVEGARNGFEHDPVAFNAHDVFPASLPVCHRGIGAHAGQCGGVPGRVAIARQG